MSKWRDNHFSKLKKEIPSTGITDINNKKSFLDKVDNKTKFYASIVIIAIGLSICIWLGLIIMLLLSYKLSRQSSNTDDKMLPIIPIVLILYFIYSDLAKPLYQDHNPLIEEIAMELNIQNSYKIQSYYNKLGYRTNWIGQASNIIYASAEKIITIPCVNRERYDKFLISGTHIKQLKSYKSIPQVIFDKTDQANQSLNNNSPIKH